MGEGSRLPLIRALELYRNNKVQQGAGKTYQSREGNWLQIERISYLEDTQRGTHNQAQTIDRVIMR